MTGRHIIAFKKDGVRFFALDSTYMSREQLEWVEKELSSTSRMEDRLLS